jgi:hypothetical protein
LYTVGGSTFERIVMPPVLFAAPGVRADTCIHGTSRRTDGGAGAVPAPGTAPSARVRTSARP